MCVHDMDITWCEPVAAPRIIHRRIGWWFLLDATKRQQDGLHRQGIPDFTEPAGTGIKMRVDAPWKSIREFLHGDVPRGPYALVARVEVTPQQYRVDRDMTSVRVVLEDRRDAAVFRLCFGEWEA